MKEQPRKRDREARREGDTERGSKSKSKREAASKVDSC